MVAERRPDGVVGRAPHRHEHQDVLCNEAHSLALEAIAEAPVSYTHLVVQGESNFTYLNTDVYGSFALAGSIFLDVDCDADFSGRYSLL